MSLALTDLVYAMTDTAYHFSSAATLVMRCALETESNIVARHCMEKARSLIDYLRKMKVEADWDLANHCLSQCETWVREMSEGGLSEFRGRNGAHPGDPKCQRLSRTYHGRSGQDQSQSMQASQNAASSGGGGSDSVEGPMLAMGGASLSSTGHDILLTSAIDQLGWQAELPEDSFFFPELWQFFHPDAASGVESR